MYKYETKYNSPAFTTAANCPAVFGRQRLVRGITIHHWDDPALAPTYDGTIAWLTRAGANSSIHYVAEAGRVACLVDVKDAAWHSGSAKGNAETVGIEMNPRASQGDYETAAELIADLRMVYGDITIYSHDYWFNTKCPGRWDVYKLDKMSYDVLWKKYRKRF